LPYTAIFAYFLLFLKKLPDHTKKQRKNFSIFSICATVPADLFCIFLSKRTQNQKKALSDEAV